MTNQVVYQTNADYETSYKSLYNSNLVASIEQTRKGIIKFRLKDMKTFFTLSPNGKLTARWNDLNEKKSLLKILEDLLVPRGDLGLTFKPVFQQMWIHYPPINFRLYWCNEKLRYNKIDINHLPKKEKQLWNLNVEFYEILTKISLEKENLEGSLFGSPLFLIHKPQIYD